MADQRRNAGNIGDLVKHSLLPILVTWFDAAQSSEWVYCETHAGYYDYPLELLKHDQQWKGERAWSIGVVERTDSMQQLGEYGKLLAAGIRQKLYPGSLKIIDGAVPSKKLKKILGWDIGCDQVDSYGNKSNRITVENGDGYLSAHAVMHSPKLIFCDPFWSKQAKTEMTKVKDLLGLESHVIVWYPISQKTEGFRKWLSAEPHSFIEVQYRHRIVNRLGWADQESRGAGLAMKGLDNKSFTNAVTLARTLRSIFEGQTHSGEPRKGKGKKTLDRILSLRVTASW